MGNADVRHSDQIAEDVPGRENEGGQEEAERSGYTICMNCYEDGTHDVYTKPLESADSSTYQDGFFGLDSHEEALKAVYASMKGGMDFKSAEESAMMGEFERGGSPTEGY